MMMCPQRLIFGKKKKKKMQHFVWDLNNGGGRGLCMSTDSGGVESSVPPS